MQQEIIPLILNKLSSYSEDIQVEAGRTFQALIIGKVSHPLLFGYIRFIDFKRQLCRRGLYSS